MGARGADNGITCTPSHFVPTSLSRSTCRRALVLAVTVAGLIPAAVATAAPSHPARPAKGAAVADAPSQAPARLSAHARATRATRATRAVVRRATRAVRRQKRAERQGNPFALRPMFVEHWNDARAQADEWRASRPDAAAAIDRIAEQPQALWLGDWSGDVRAAAARRVAAARAAGALPVLVAYNVPQRDCGGQHSSGGAATAAAYRAWIEALATGIGAGPAVVVLEPDGLAGLDCLSPAGRAERISLIADAAVRLDRQPGVSVYIDAGNPGWIPAAEMARRLRDAGVGRVRGFAVNVASFYTTARSRAYGRAISRRVGGAPFVIDSSRNGAGPGGGWCNPAGGALGDAPTAATGDPLVDALLWVKRPGESDGTCNGGPAAGRWWPEGALALARP